MTKVNRKILYVSSLSSITKLDKHLLSSNKASSIKSTDFCLNITKTKQKQNFRCLKLKPTRSSYANCPNSNFHLILAGKDKNLYSFIRTNYFNSIFIDFSGLNSKFLSNYLTQDIDISSQHLHQSINQLKDHINYPDNPFLLNFVAIVPKEHSHYRPIISELTNHLPDHNIVDIIFSKNQCSQTWNQVYKWLIADAIEHNKLDHQKVGLSITGGGVNGFLYGLGTLCALDKIFNNTSTTDLEAYAGVSSGAFLAAMLALSAPPQQIHQAITNGYGSLPKLSAKILYSLSAQDYKNFHKKIFFHKTIPQIKFFKELMAGAFSDGIFTGKALEEYFCTACEYLGLGSNYNNLSSKLFIGITDKKTFNHHSIEYIPELIKANENNINLPELSKAIRASSAIPPVYSSVQFNNRDYIDGQITKCSDFEKLIVSGCSMIIIINPITPFGKDETNHSRGGLYYLLQSVKALLSSRLHQTIINLKKTHRHCDFILIEPDNYIREKLKGNPITKSINYALISDTTEETISSFNKNYKYYQDIFRNHHIDLDLSI